jgi:hypothetical protein
LSFLKKKQACFSPFKKWRFFKRRSYANEKQARGKMGKKQDRGKMGKKQVCFFPPMLVFSPYVFFPPIPVLKRAFLFIKKGREICMFLLPFGPVYLPRNVLPFFMKRSSPLENVIK